MHISIVLRFLEDSVVKNDFEESSLKVIAGAKNSLTAFSILKYCSRRGVLTVR